MHHLQTTALYCVNEIKYVAITTVLCILQRKNNNKTEKKFNFLSGDVHLKSDTQQILLRYYRVYFLSANC